MWSRVCGMPSSHGISPWKINYEVQLFADAIHDVNEHAETIM